MPRAVTGTHRTVRAPGLASSRHPADVPSPRAASDRELADLDVPQDQGRQAGITNLLACTGHPSFAQNCWSHASRTPPGLIDVGAETGRQSPLLHWRHTDTSRPRASHRRGSVHTPNNPVIATVATATGTDMTVLRRASPPSRRVALALHSQARGYPVFSSLLDTVIRAMVHA